MRPLARFDAARIASSTLVSASSASSAPEGGAFRRQITDGREFDWQSVLFGQRAFANEFQPGDRVVQVDLAWVDDIRHAALIVKRSDGRSMTATHKGWLWGDQGSAM